MLVSQNKQHQTQEFKTINNFQLSQIISPHKVPIEQNEDMEIEQEEIWKMKNKMNSQL